MNRTRWSLARLMLAGLAVGCMLVTAGGASAQVDTKDAARAALQWMQSQQQADGSFPGFGAGSTVDAVLAILAAGQDPATYTRGSNSPVTFLQSQAAELAKTPGGAGKLLIAVAAMGMDGTSFGGINLVNVIDSSYDAAKGQYGKDVIGDAFAVLGLKAAGQQVPAKAVEFLASVQNSDGGWSFSGEQGAGKADTNTTSVVLQAFTAVGGAQPLTIKHAVIYMVSQENKDGGTPYQQGGDFGSDSDVNSTAYAVQAMLALGNTTEADRGIGFILSMRLPSGGFQWKTSEKGENAGATYQAVPAILGATLINPKNGTHTPGSSTGTTQPGMPTTGGGPELPLAAVAALAALLAGAGLLLRSKASER